MPDPPPDPRDYTRLVYRVVGGMLRGRNDPDAIQNGYIGLLAATRTYDPALGPFLHHAATAIHEYAARGLRRRGRLGRFGSHKANDRLFWHAHKVTPAGGVLPRAWAEEILQEGLTESEYASVVGMLEGREASLDRPVDGHPHAPTLAEALPDLETPSPEDLASLAEWRPLLRGVREELSGLAALVFDLRLLPADGDPLSLAEVGAMRGLSKERVRQIEARVRHAIRTRAEAAGLL